VPFVVGEMVRVRCMIGPRIKILGF